MTQLDTLSSELQRRDPRFLRILSTNAAEGQGEYEVRSATTGRTLRQTFTFEGERILTLLFDEATRLRLAAEAEAAPDPYAQGLAKLRALRDSPASKFEDQWKAARLRDLEVEAAAVAAEVATVPRMTAAEEAELASYAPPDPYAAGLKALREKKTR